MEDTHNIRIVDYKESLEYKNPGLAAEWHPTKNGDLKPSQIGVGNEYKAWWIYPYDDPETGKHFDFEWQARVDNRHNQRLRGERGVPFFSGDRIWTGFNDLASKRPDLVEEWDYERNKGLKNRYGEQLLPTNIGVQSNKKVWWHIFVEKNGEQIELSWDATVCHRTRKDRMDGCPYIGIAPKRILKGFNDMESNYPILAEQWSPKNPIGPDEVMKGCNKIYKWNLKYFDEKTKKEFVFEWDAAPAWRNPDGSDNVFLANKRVWPGFNDLLSIFPEVAKEWDYEKNDNLKPEDVCYMTQKKYYWIKEIVNKDGSTEMYSWKQSPYIRTIMGRGCPAEGHNQFSLRKGYNDFKTLYPDLAKTWNYSRNELNPEEYQVGSPKEVWWIEEVGDDNGNKALFEWKSGISRRISSNKCPFYTFSRLHKRVITLLYEKNIGFITEYSVKGLRSKNALLFDIRLDNGTFIEVDGTQHFSPKFNTSDRDFQKVIENDNKKNDYCHKNNIGLLRIPYVFDGNDYELSHIIDCFYKKGIVFDSVKDFYKKVEFSKYI